MMLAVDCTVVILACILLMQGHNAKATVYSMELCQSGEWIGLTGADVFSQFEPCYDTISTTNCTLALKAPLESMQLMVQFIILDTDRQEPCRDKLTLQEVTADQQRRPLLDGFCGNLEDLQGTAALYTSSPRLLITWQTAPHRQSHDCHRGFHLIVTAVIRPPETCPESGYMRCNDDNCIPETLRCDGTRNCVGGEDELGCRMDLPAAANFQDDEMNENLTLDINSNPSYGDEPVTPPPRYSYLERQMSFTSHISQTSDQLSIPPDYEEAIELTGNGRPRPSRLSRSSTGSTRRARSRLFSRTPSQDVSRPSVIHTASQGSDAEPRLSVSSDYSDVFINGQRASPPPSIISEESGEEENVVAPSMMRSPPMAAGAASPERQHRVTIETRDGNGTQPAQAILQDQTSMPTTAIVPDTHHPQL